MVVLTHIASGPASLATVLWSVHPHLTDRITGGFRIVDKTKNGKVIVGNGEDPERFWEIDPKYLEEA